MNIPDTIESVEVDLHSMQAIIGAYFDSASNMDSDIKSEIKRRIVEENDISSEALRAVNDAIVYSTLMTTLHEDDDFVQALHIVQPIENDILRKMRMDLFLEAVETINEAISFGKSERSMQEARLASAKNTFMNQN
jgi:hypothetical protein